MNSIDRPSRALRSSNRSSTCACTNVERGDRFVGDQDFRVERQRPRNADALPLPAGKLMRKAFHRARH
jgi:hypothetical protein